jgi:uncharacterized protein (DUF58 family)
MAGIKKKGNVNELSWTAHPARERPRATILLALFIVALEIGIYYSFQSLFVVLLALAFLVVSLSAYIFPTGYLLDGEGVTVKGIIFRQTRPWRQFRTYYADKRGVQLSTFVRPSRLDPFRGVSLLFSKDNREEVLAFVRQRMATAKEERLAGISDAGRREKIAGKKKPMGKSVGKSKR